MINQVNHLYSMSKAVFQAPKRRAKTYESCEAPLPILLAREDKDHIYRAEIISHHVIVKDPVHIHALYERGYFGKGVFSRSRPEHEISQQWKYIGDKCLPVMSPSDYQKRVSWARAALLMQGLDDDAVNHALQNLTKPVKLDTGKKHGPEPIKSQAEHFCGSSGDHLMDNVSGDTHLNIEKSIMDQIDTAKPQRQGNPLYDPLAVLYPKEPEQLAPEIEHSKSHVKCKQHDDWIILSDDNQCIRSKLRTPDTDPSEGYEYVLVVEPENDDSENSTKDNCSIEQFSKLVCRINPFTMMEYLQLSYEEAFFLIYALGCLSVYYCGEPLSVHQAWTMFHSVQPNFSTTYAAYHYFRAKGWVPKSGIKYGTDLMLYRKGPPFYHASYSVVVDRVNDSFMCPAMRPFTWRSLAALSRITGNVSKELMLCSILTPSDVTEDMLSSPECLKRLRVQEVIVNRWVSSKERTEQDDL